MSAWAAVSWSFHSLMQAVTGAPDKINEQTRVNRTLLEMIIILRFWGVVALLPGDLHLFERLFVIGLENNRDCDITMPLSLKTMEVQIKGNQ